MSLFYLFSDPSEWRTLGNALGLAPYQATAGYSRAGTFRHMKRALGLPAAAHPPSFNDWLYGRWRDVEVLLGIYCVGSGRNRSWYTAVSARIDPPLFLGLGVYDKPFLELFHDPPFLTGIPLLDQNLRISAFDTRRALRFLNPNAPEMSDFWQRVIANIDSLSITDSIVTFTSRGRVVDLSIRPQLDLVTYLASFLGQRRAQLGWTEAEAAQQAEWQRFADENRLSFDKQRMMLIGDYKGAHTKIALETAGKHIGSSINVRFPQPVNVSFSIRRTRLGFLSGLFEQDITIGDPLFDDQYQVTGYPEQHVRHVLAKPVLLQTLKNLGSATTDVQLNSRELYFRLSDPLMTTTSLASVCETGHIACASFFGEVQGIGPYR